MIRVIHKPTLIRKFSYFVRDNHPIAWGVFYSAVNSLPPAVCEKQFGENKEDLLTRFELGVEISLARENYLTTSSIEVLQGFVLWLTCITKEDDMGTLAIVASRLSLTILCRESMGFTWCYYSNRLESRSSSRSIIIPYRLNGRYHYRTSSTAMASNMPFGVPRRRM